MRVNLNERNPPHPNPLPRRGEGRLVIRVSDFDFVQDLVIGISDFVTGGASFAPARLL